MKYERKIEEFFKIHKKENYVVLKEEKLKSIIDIITKSINKKYNIKLVSLNKLNKLHEKDEPPLLYFYFKNNKLYNNEFKYFIDWYNINSFNISRIMDKNNILFNPPKEREILHKIYDNPFICIDIIQEIETNNIIHEKYLIDNKHNIDIFLLDEINKPDLNLIAIIIDFLKTISGKEYNVNLVIIFTNHKKIITHKILNCSNINSGSSQPTHIITCYRKEEFYKVLLHELIHYYKFDFYYTDKYYEKLEEKLLVPKIEGIDRLNECYTESFTIILFSCFLSLYYKKKTIQEYINNEINFSLFQIAKILKLNEAKNFNEYLENKIIIKQKTSVRSYFFIKLFLLLNIDEFINFFNENYYIENKRLLDFGDLINSSYTKINKSVIDKINYYINLEFEDKWIFKTMRLTSFF